MTELEKNLNEIENMFKAGIIDVNDYKQMKLQITASIENIAIVETPSDGQPPLPGRTAPSPDSPKLHVSINGAEAVIYERDEVIQKIINKEIKRDAMVWRKGMPDWVQAGTLPELEDVFSEIPPPPAFAPPPAASSLPPVQRPAASPPPAQRPAAQTNNVPSSSGVHLIEFNLALRDSQGKQTVDNINPFFDSVKKILEEFNFKAKRGSLYLKSVTASDADVTVWIGFTGDINGRLLLNIAKDSALFTAGVMCSDTLKVFDDLVKSAIDNLTNIIAHTAMEKLSEAGIKINLTKPAVFDGNYSEKDINLFDREAIIMPFEISI